RFPQGNRVDRRISARERSSSWLSGEGSAESGDGIAGFGGLIVRSRGELGKLDGRNWKLVLAPGGPRAGQSSAAGPNLVCKPVHRPAALPTACAGRRIGTKGNSDSGLLVAREPCSRGGPAGHRPGHGREAGPRHGQEFCVHSPVRLVLAL